MTSHDDLPLPDYDSLPTGSIESRVRALDDAGVRRILDYEKDHANRVQVVQLLEHRLQALDAGSAEPSGGDPNAPAPEIPEAAPPGDSKASPQTQGPPQNPPSQGVPTNPAQPRR